jgi:signal transduction histidine kinase
MDIISGSKNDLQSNGLYELVDSIVRSADAARHVLNDALDLQRLQAGMFDFVKKPFVVVNSHLHAAKMMKPQLEHKGISVNECNNPPHYSNFCVLITSNLSRCNTTLTSDWKTWWSKAICIELSKSFLTSSPTLANSLPRVV